MLSEESVDKRDSSAITVSVISDEVMQRAAETYAIVLCLRLCRLFP